MTTSEGPAPGRELTPEQEAVRTLGLMIHDFHARRVEQCRYCGGGDGKIYACDVSSCRFLGNGPFTIDQVKESLDHFASREGLELDALDCLSRPEAEAMLFDCALSILRRCALGCKQGALEAATGCQADCPLYPLGPKLVSGAIGLLSGLMGESVIDLGGTQCAQ
jgi:hypothetical protein